MVSILASGFCSLILGSLHLRFHHVILMNEWAGQNFCTIPLLCRFFWSKIKQLPILVEPLCQHTLRFKMMFLPGVVLCGSAAVSFKLPPRESVAQVAQEKMVFDSEQPEFCNLVDIIQGNKKMPGMGAWSSINLSKAGVK